MNDCSIPRRVMEQVEFKEGLAMDLPDDCPSCGTNSPWDGNGRCKACGASSTGTADWLETELDLGD